MPPRADGRPLPELQLLVGPATATAALARALGFAYQPQEGPSRYAHAAGFAIATPDGRLSRYFFGLQFDPPALRQALVDAGDGRIGSLAERLLLLCAHFDPRNGRHSATVMGVARAVGGAAIAGTVLLVLWQRRRPRADAGAAR
jgi:protein SCO1/2